MTIKTTGSGSELRVITKTVDGEVRVSCSCCCAFDEFYVGSVPDTITTYNTITVRVETTAASWDCYDFDEFYEYYIAGSITAGDYTITYKAETTDAGCRAVCDSSTGETGEANSSRCASGLSGTILESAKTSFSGCTKTDSGLSCTDATGSCTNASDIDCTVAGQSGLEAYSTSSAILPFLVSSESSDWDSVTSTVRSRVTTVAIAVPTPSGGFLSDFCGATYDVTETQTLSNT